MIVQAEYDRSAGRPKDFIERRIDRHCASQSLSNREPLMQARLRLINDWIIGQRSYDPPSEGLPSTINTAVEGE